MLTLRQLRYLDALAQEGHFGKAAERVSVSQPALSMQIRELEAALGATLVERSASGARLTLTGEGVVARARRILAEVGDLESFASRKAGDLAGPLRIGVIPSIAPYLLPKLLPRLSEEFPRLQLSIRETVTATLVDELAAGTLDLVIASLPLEHPSFEEVTVFSDAFLLARPNRGRFAELQVHAASEIAPESLLLLEDGHCLRDQTLNVCGGIDARRLRSSGVTSLSTILQLVAAGQGITLLPEIFLRSVPVDPSEIQVSRFSSPEPCRAVGMAWRRSNPRAEEFRRLLPSVAGCSGSLVAPA
ncbi:Morphology and auto-aggregation control protein [Hartmannibacter diazotrophicus]|uniref:Morphology and auto-aggregation control protein n=1 Tax=Hartmannibacter diazotrophicus TaxID=1482074 RepID=A0A2C9D596_9HYPH|nr:hydrogen peroxide-inducible genes activator [Hartmannibacter diazotrophicus]SON55484.1 Morphology and auto-aggregation control protein [Hartmannibacter diazotrophicus]